MIRHFTLFLGTAALLASPLAAQGMDSTIQQVGQAVLGNPAGDAYEQPRTGGLLGGIFGCSTSGNSQTIGAVAGGAIGGLLGNRIAGSGRRTLGTVLGGALGAAAGSAVGCKLQKNDRMRAERAAQAAVASGQSQTWRNEETGASGRVDVAGTGSALGDLKFASGVEPAAGFTRVGDSFAATAAANIRTAPNSRGQIIGRLTPGQRVWVPAQVRGQPWMLVAEGGVGQGYVSAPLLRRATTVAASNCRMVTQTVEVPGAAAQAESYHACRGTDGQWTMTRV